MSIKETEFSTLIMHFWRFFFFKSYFFKIQFSVLWRNTYIKRNFQISILGFLHTSPMIAIKFLASPTKRHQYTCFFVVSGTISQHQATPEHAHSRHSSPIQEFKLTQYWTLFPRSSYEGVQQGSHCRTGPWKRGVGPFDRIPPSLNGKSSVSLWSAISPGANTYLFLCTPSRCSTGLL